MPVVPLVAMFVRGSTFVIVRSERKGLKYWSAAVVT